MPVAPQPPAASPDEQDLINHLLAAAVQAAAVLSNTRRTAALLTAFQPEAAAHLTDAATALTRTRDAMVHAADELHARKRS